MHLHSDNSKSAGLLLLLLVCCGSLPATEGELPPAAQHKVDFEKEIRRNMPRREKAKGRAPARPAIRGAEGRRLRGGHPARQGC